VKCLVCQESWKESKGAICPQCGYDHATPDFNNAQSIQRARQEFRDKSTAYAPHKRVKRWDKMVPWMALGLGLALFIVWIKACTSFTPW